MNEKLDVKALDILKRLYSLWNNSIEEWYYKEHAMSYDGETHQRKMLNLLNEIKDLLYENNIE